MIKGKGSQLPDTTKTIHYFHRPDTIHFNSIKSSLKSESNFTYKKYVEFLTKISDTSKYIVLPLKDFNKTINSKKIIIGLRHDVDLDLEVANKLATVENNFGFRTSYFILHTAKYYLEKPNDMAVHNQSIIPILKKMQNDYHHEIGFHNDLITLQLVYKIDPISFLHHELAWLRENGLFISGTASHGSTYCYTYHYVNWYFFKEFPNPNVAKFNNFESAVVDDEKIIYKKALLKDFNLDYEAYFINFNKYYSDASFINGQRWNFDMLDLNTLHPGDRVQILMHPIYYSLVGSSLSEISSFSIPGQIKSEINSDQASIVVDIPENVNLNNLKTNFVLSTGARARLGSKECQSNFTSINFTKPVTIKVVAEDGLTFKNWTITLNQIHTLTNPIVQIFPNPVKSEINFQFNNVTGDLSKFYIINVNGQLVFTTELVVQEGLINYTFNASKMDNGFYFVKLVSGNKQVVGTFVVNK